jgi:hypothetical protein
MDTILIPRTQQPLQRVSQTFSSHFMTSQTGSRQGAAVRLLDHSAAFHDVQPMPLLAPRYAPELAHQVKEYDETFRA